MVSSRPSTSEIIRVHTDDRTTGVFVVACTAFAVKERDHDEAVFRVALGEQFVSVVRQFEKMLEMSVEISAVA